MSDELDDELRDQAWRRHAPGITDAEIDALDGLYDEQGKVKAPYGPAHVLAAYRLGRAAQAPDAAALDDDRAVQVVGERLRAAAAALPRIDVTDQDRTILRWLANYMQGPTSSRPVAVARALLGTDTTREAG